MNNKKEIAEALEMDYTTYKKIKGSMDPKTSVKITGDKPLPTSTTVTEEEGDIEPKDKETIKYLSNIKDPNTNEISKPFVIGGKRYQMVRGKLKSKGIVSAVYCHDDLNENGENIIHDVEYFDKHIATPNKENKGANEGVNDDSEGVNNDSDSFEGYKHFFVNKNNGSVRKFKNINDVFSSGNKQDDETYLGVREFKQYMNEKMFGNRKKVSSITEIAPNGEESDEEMNVKAKKLMDLIAKRIPDNIIDTIKSPVAKREVIAAFAEMIGVPRNGLTGLIGGLKVLSKTNDTEPTMTESTVFTKNALLESLNIPTNKIIKVKDIK